MAEVVPCARQRRKMWSFSKLCLVSTAMTTTTAQINTTCVTKLSYLSNQTGFKFHLGSSLAMLGDIDGDGVNDFAVGMPGDSHDVNSAGILGDGPAGSVLIVRRHADRTAKQVHKWPRKEDDDVSSLSGFGANLAAISDLDNDGVKELVVSFNEYFTAEGRHGNGLLTLFLSKAGIVKKRAPPVFYSTVAPELGYTGPGGSSLANLGDIDADEIDDIAVGAQCDQPDDSTVGCVYICRMQLDGTVSFCNRIDDPVNFLSQGNVVGGWIAAIGDMNNDGFGDLAVGARGFEHNVSFFVLFMTLDGKVRNVSKLQANTDFFESRNNLGRPLAMARIGSSQRLLVGDANGGGAGSVAGFTIQTPLALEGTVVEDMPPISVFEVGFAPLIDSGFGSSVIFLEGNVNGTFQVCVGASGDDELNEDGGALWEISVGSCNQSSPKDDTFPGLPPKSTAAPAPTFADPSPPGGSPGSIRTFDEKDSKQRKKSHSTLLPVAVLVAAVLFCCCLSLVVVGHRRVRRRSPLRQADPTPKCGPAPQTRHANQSRHVSWAPSVSLRDEDPRLDNALKTLHKAQPPKIAALVGCQLPEYDGESEDEATPGGRRCKLLV